MEAVADLEQLYNQDPFDDATFEQVRQMVGQAGRQRERLMMLLEELEEQAADDAGRSKLALRLGLGWCLLGRHRPAADWLQQTQDCKLKHYYLARALRQLRQYDTALEQLDAAATAGWDPVECDLEKVRTLLKADRLDEAEAAAGQISGRAERHAGFHVVEGLLLEQQGLREAAIDRFKKALEVDEACVEARFRLAYSLDLQGEDEQAIDQYEQCVEQEPAHVNALVNLAVLYEDAADYEDAERCLRQVLASDPNHPRARLFMREVTSSQQMFIDEDQERIREKRDAILDTPISDFELSVRSRNCLKKMNIFTLGDLLRISEAELLAYKNFGETSLTEIKAMLAQRGLRLGQLLEEQQSAARQEALERVTAAGAPEVLDKPVTELELSVRSRKCLQRLNIETLGDLTSRTEAELLGAKNFGQTSLNEVKQRLTEYGLNLRQISG